MRCLYSSKIYEQYLGIKCTHWIDQSRQAEREEGKIESDFVFIAASDAWLFKLSVTKAQNMFFPILGFCYCKANILYCTG